MVIYYIGGSPCSGKSTTAEILSKRYGLYYFKVDDYLDGYMEQGAAKGYEICKKQTEFSSDQIWMRDPKIQCIEEIQWYEEVFEFAQKDLQAITSTKGIITEGAAFMPKLMKKIGVPNNRYLSLTPTKEFQLFHFKQREFVPYILRNCSDPQEAFNNWMGRDILFAKEMQKQCNEEGYKSIINNGQFLIEDMVDMIAIHFGLKE